MLHALPRRSLKARVGRPVLPALLLTAATGAFGGLAMAGSPPAAAPVAEARVLPQAQVVPREQLADLDRASRSLARQPLPSPTPPKPAPKPAPPKATPTPKPVVKASAKPTPKVRQKQTAARVVGGTCPVPAASFSDTWGAPRSGGRSHQGTDLLAPYGSPVYAVTSGRIDTTSSSNGGISLYLRGDNGERYFYAHNSENVAGDGQRVVAGELIARVGSTGNAGSTNHVHFEREVGGTSVNPYDFVRSLCR